MNSTASHLPPPDESNILDGPGEAALFLAKHRAKLIPSVLLVVAVVAGGVYWLFHEHDVRIKSEALLAEASDTAGWQQVVSDYPGTPAAGNAALLLAASLRDAGKLEESSKAYEDFLASQPEHQLAAVAAYGLAVNLKVEGKKSEAIDAFAGVKMQYGTSFVAPLALLDEVRLLLAQSKLEEARQVLSDLVAEYASTPAAQIAGNELNRLALVGGGQAPAKVEKPPAE